MQVTEILNEGLKRELKITFDAEELSSRRDERLAELKNTIRLDGFRPGKVPIPHLKKIYGRHAMAQVVEKVLEEGAQEALVERDEKPAYRPEVTLADEDGIETILAGDAELELSVVFEVIPDIEDVDLSKMKIEKPVAEVTDAVVDNALKDLAERHKEFVEKDEDAAAEMGDQVVVDFDGRIDGEPFDGGEARGMPLELGSNQMIPGFEEQLVGVKTGSEKSLNVTFPKDYPKESLAGKIAVFDVTVHEVNAPKGGDVDDDFARRLGAENLETFKETIRGQIRENFENASKERLKKAVLDELDELTKFDLPEKMVEEEFNRIWSLVTRTVDESDETSEDDAHKEYRRIAERRVKLGLLLGRIGERDGVQVATEDLHDALIERLREMPPGLRQEAYGHYRDNPEAMNELRAPAFEAKVLDHIISRIEVTPKTVAREELFRDSDDDDESDAATGDL